MKGSRTPLWLICDVAACFRLHLALRVLAFAVRRFLPRHRPPTADGVAWVTAWLAGCERLLRWVIARQAFRLCGLDPRLARNFAISEATNSIAWTARLGVLLHMYASMTGLARRWARRIKAVLAAPRTAFADDCAAVSLLSPTLPVVAPSAPAAPAGQRIRAPPWLLHEPANTSPAPCRSTGEVAGVCVFSLQVEGMSPASSGSPTMRVRAQRSLRIA